MRFTLTAGQKGDTPQAATLIEGLPAEVVMTEGLFFIIAFSFYGLNHHPSYC